MRVLDTNMVVKVLRNCRIGGVNLHEVEMGSRSSGIRSRA